MSEPIANPASEPPYVVTLVVHFDTAEERDEWLRKNGAGLADSALDAETLRLALRAQGKLAGDHMPSSVQVTDGDNECCSSCGYPRWSPPGVQCAGRAGHSLGRRAAL